MKRTPPLLHPVDLDRLEQEIEHEVASFHRPSPQLPSVEFQPEPEQDIGRLSADAALEQYKLAAKSIEEMGEEIQTRIRALETALHECDADMKLLQEAAKAIMDKGKLAHAEIERTTTVAKEIRDMVNASKAKLS